MDCRFGLFVLFLVFVCLVVELWVVILSFLFFVGWCWYLFREVVFKIKGDNICKLFGIRVGIF